MSANSSGAPNASAQLASLEAMRPDPEGTPTPVRVGLFVIDIRDLFYYGGLTIFFLYLNTLVIDLRRWR